MMQQTEMASEYQGMGLQECIQNCMNCHAVCLQTVEYCYKASLHGTSTRMDTPDHMRFLMDCAQICQTSAGFMLRESTLHGRLCGVCAEVCEACAQSCESFQGDAQSSQCAAACRQCASSCRRMSQMA